MRRAGRLTRKTNLHRISTLLSDDERAAYAEATERARALEGYLECEHCGRSLLDREAERHHLVYRSHGGPTTTGNLILLCRDCHAAFHRRNPPLHPDLAPCHGMLVEAPAIYVVQTADMDEEGTNP